MFVVADTTPLNYLVPLGKIDLLPPIYERIAIPPVVLAELSHRKTPPEVSRWASQLPDWCSILAPVSVPDDVLRLLDPGERDAIQLALDAGFGTLLMDEIKGRREAQRRGLRVVGTISILETASRLGLIEFGTTLERLEQLGFRLSGRLREEFLRRNC
jgi:predicted nucleic acid-binding protein